MLNVDVNRGFHVPVNGEYLPYPLALTLLCGCNSADFSSFCGKSSRRRVFRPLTRVLPTSSGLAYRDLIRVAPLNVGDNFQCASLPFPSQDRNILIKISTKQRRKANPTPAPWSSYQCSTTPGAHSTPTSGIAAATDRSDSSWEPWVAVHWQHSGCG